CTYCFFPVPSLPGAHSLRLSSTFDRIGAEIQDADPDAIVSTAAAWNGSEYLPLAVNYHWVDAIRVASDGTILGKTRLNARPSDGNQVGTPSVLASGEDFIVTWRELGATGAITSNPAFVSTVRADGTSTAPQPFAEGSLATGDPILVRDPRGTTRVIR